MTPSEINSRIQNWFNNPTYYTGDDINASLQDGYDEVGAFAGLFLKSAIVPFQANLSYYDMIALLPDYIGVMAIFNSAIKRWMTSANMMRFDKDRIDWEVATGVPYFFSVISHRYIAIYKKPAVPNYGNMYVFYHAASPTLGANDTVAIPFDYFNTLEDYILMDLWSQNQEWIKAMDHREAYINNLKELKTYIKEQRNPDRVPMLLP